MIMNNETILHVLSDHNIDAHIEAGRVMALDDSNQLMPDGSTEDVKTWVDVTGYTECQLKRWLNY